MIAKSTLYVYLNTKKVGSLIQESTGAISFLYAKEWIRQFPDYGISLNLPVRENPYKGDEVLSFFDNLLPDNYEIRKKMAEKVRARSSRTFDLIDEVGADCVGALRFLSKEVELEKLPDIQGRVLDDKEIADIIKNLGINPLGMKENEFRLSIAGAQEKTALLKDQGHWKLPLGATPTTHILKPPMGLLHNGIDLSTSVENEFLCLKLMELFGFDVCKTSIENFDSRKCLVAERFDRTWIGAKKVARIAQEDFCQAMGYGPEQKYESDGGPGIEKIMGFLDASLEREKDRRDFMKSQILFWLLGATDGHAKNYSVFLRPQGFFMTPFYDIMSVYPALEDRQIELRQMKLSLKVGNSRHDSFKKIRLKHFFETGKACGFSSKQVERIVDEIKSVSRKKLESVKVPKDFDLKIFEAIVGNLWKKIEKM